MTDQGKIESFGPYTPVRQVGDLYFVSGQVGVDFNTKTAGTDITAQTTKALDNLAATLATVGLTLNDVVKTTVFLTNLDDVSVFNGIYTARFSGQRPARSMVAVSELPRVADCPLIVEIEAVAARGQI